MFEQEKRGCFFPQPDIIIAVGPPLSQVLIGTISPCEILYVFFHLRSSVVGSLYTYEFNLTKTVGVNVPYPFGHADVGYYLILYFLPIRVPIRGIRHISSGTKFPGDHQRSPGIYNHHIHIPSIGGAAWW